VPYCQKYTPTDCFCRRLCPLGKYSRTISYNFECF